MRQTRAVPGAVLPPHEAGSVMKAILGWLKIHARPGWPVWFSARRNAGGNDPRLAAAESRATAADARLCRLIAQNPDGLWEWEPAADHWYFSPRFREMAGYGDEREFRREFDFRHAIHGDDQARVAAAWQSALAEGKPCREVFRLRCRQNYRWVVACATPDAGRLSGSLSDHEARKTLELALSESRQHVDTIFQCSQDGLWEWHIDAAAENHRYSPRYAAMLGYAPDELPAGRDAFLEFLHGDERPRIEAGIRRLLLEDLPFDTEHRLHRRDGSWLWVRTRVRILRAVDRCDTHLLGSCTDISREREALDAVRLLLAEKRALEDNAVAGILHMRGQIIAGCNRILQELLGYAEGELIGNSLALLLHSPHEAERLEREARARLARGERYARETGLRHKDGSLLWCLLSASGAACGQGEVQRVWMFADLSRQKRMVDALRLERDFSNALVSHLPGVFCLLDEDCRIIRWNTNFEHQTGFSAREILHLRWDDCIVDGQADNARALVDKARQLGAASAMLDLKKHADCASPHHFTGVRVRVDDAEHVVLLGLDMTEQENAARHIQQLNTNLERRVTTRTAELQAANLELESFSYSVSHDLSAPLRGIAGFSKILEEDYGAILDETAHSHLARIRAGTAKMQQLIDDLLKLSRISREEMRHEWVDLSQLSRDILQELRSADSRREVITIISEGISVQGDANLLRIALDNLLRNAWKFTSRKEISKIEFGILQKDGKSVYFVRDDGAGFDMAHASRLFKAFERLHHATEFEGTGVGLAIVSRIIQRHGGEIWADSATDRGATFYFTLS